VIAVRNYGEAPSFEVWSGFRRCGELFATTWSETFYPHGPWMHWSDRTGTLFCHPSQPDRLAA